MTRNLLYSKVLSGLLIAALICRSLIPEISLTPAHAGIGIRKQLNEPVLVQNQKSGIYYFNNKNKKSNSDLRHKYITGHLIDHFKNIPGDCFSNRIFIKKPFYVFISIKAP